LGIGLVSSIVAGNNVNASVATVPELFPGIGSITATLSLIGNNSGTSLAAAPTPDANGNLVGTAASPINPLLDALANNGGPTQTHALLPGSPAIDRGTAAGRTFDQRGPGFSRTLGLATDMGALESPFVSLIVTTENDELDAVLAPNDLSLREAVAYANGNPGADTITFEASRFTSTGGMPDKPILLTMGQMTITDELTITGLGADKILVDAQQNSRIFQIGTTGSETFPVTFEGLTLTGGNVFDSFGARGGAIGSYTTGLLTLNQTTVSGNTARSSAAFSISSGGGIFAYGVVSLTGSTVSGNTASSISPTSSTRGGGIYAFGAIMLTDSTVSGNMADSHLGANTGGGGIWGYGAVTLTCSTVSGNTARSLGSSALSSGGGISARGALTLTGSTVSGNTASARVSAGGGIYGEFGAANIDLTSSIIAGNTVGGVNATGPDLIAFGGGSITAAFSLIGINAGTPLAAAFPTPDAQGNLIGTTNSPIDSMLDVLANNGGPTKTHALRSGSPARDRGTAAGQTFDQRGSGFPRTIGLGTDIGAFEAITFDFNGTGADADSNDLVWALQAGRYNQSALFGQGDANGNGIFDAADVTALLNSGLYQTGPLWPQAPNPSAEYLLPMGAAGDGQISLEYNPATGNVRLITDGPLVSAIQLLSAAGHLTGTGSLWTPTGLDVRAPTLAFHMMNAVTGTGFNVFDFGTIAVPNLTQAQILAGWKIDGALLSGGALGYVDLIYLGPGPTPGSLAVSQIGSAVMIQGTNVSNNVIVSVSGTGNVRVIRTTGPPVTLGLISTIDRIVIQSFAGADNLTINQGITTPVVILSGDGNDTISLGSGESYVYAGNNNDTVNVRDSRALVFGEAGNDIINGGSQPSVFVGGDGTDTISGGTAATIRIGGRGIDRVFGGTAKDVIIGGYTTYDDKVHEAALLSLLATWLLPSSTYPLLIPSGAGATVFDNDPNDMLKAKDNGFDVVFANLADKYDLDGSNIDTVWIV
jgi:hypothetical protein